MQKLTILHVSDLHFVDPDLNYLNLFKSKDIRSKKAIGLLNIKLKRNKQFQPEHRLRLIQKLLDLNWDYLLITGDLTNIAAEEEFVIARRELMPLFKKGPVIIIPGNHDFYVRKALRDGFFYKYFGDLIFNTDSNNQLNSVVELSKKAVIFTMDMSRPAPFFSSRGKIDPRQIDKLDGILSNKFQDHIKIAIGHYPVFYPTGISESFFHSLSKPSVFKEFLIRNKIHLYLHGHIHKSWLIESNKDMPLISINSGGCCRHTKGKWSGFHQIELTDQKIEVVKQMV